MATCLRILGLDITPAIIWRFEAPLDQEIGDRILEDVFIAAFRVRGLFLKQNLESIALLGGTYILAI
ncbi:MAG: hypothetical protein ABSD38_35500 [Syntrophorhabdales bacterium]